MPKSPNQKLKLLYLMQILLEQSDQDHPLTLTDLLDALRIRGVSAERKSIYSDFESLRLYGLDVEKTATRPPAYYIANRNFELPELKLLVDAVQSSRFITHKKSTELIEKIEHLASHAQAQQLQRQVCVSNRIKTMNESIYYAVDALHEAISQNVQIAFQYFEWNEKKEKVPRHNGRRYVVSPWALSWTDENYYLIAYDGLDAKIKHYRVDKMLHLTLLEEKRQGQSAFANFDLSVYTQRTFGMFGGQEEAVRLRCAKRIVGIMIDRFGTEPIFVPDGDSHFTVTVRVALSPLFFTWLMNFGRDIQILSPQTAISAYLKTAHEALALYSDARS